MTKEEFGQLVIRTTDDLYRVSKGILRNDSDCEDAVWEAIGTGFEKLHTLNHDQYAKTWLIRILIHECYRILRRRKLETSMDAETAGRHASVSSGESHSDLYEALFHLDEKYRIPLILYYLEGYSVREIAGIFQKTEGTVKSWLSRGRISLRKMLEEGD